MLCSHRAPKLKLRQSMAARWLLYPSTMSSFCCWEVGHTAEGVTKWLRARHSGQVRACSGEGSRQQWCMT